MTTVSPLTWMAWFTRSQMSGSNFPLSSRVDWVSNPRIAASRIQDGPPSRSTSMNRISEYRTSSGVITFPSWNFTPGRILKV